MRKLAMICDFGRFDTFDAVTVLLTWYRDKVRGVDSLNMIYDEWMSDYTMSEKESLDYVKERFFI